MPDADRRLTPERTVLVPVARLARWLSNFEGRHGPYAVSAGPLTAVAADGSTAAIDGPFGLELDELVDAILAGASVLPEVRWGVLLVRKGGFAVAAGTGPKPALTKVGRRHVQGRTAAGGWSQQRFARRRDNQARQAFEAAADHAHRILVHEHPVDALVCGGDRVAVEAVLGDPRLRALAARVTEPWLDVPDPNAQVLARAVADAWSCRVTIREPLADAAGTEAENS